MAVGSAGCVRSFVLRFFAVVLCSGITDGPRTSQRTPPTQAAKVPTAAKPAPRRAAPTILAVDSRIARRVNALRPSVKRRLKRVLHKLPPRISILVTSAHRTRAEQRALRGTFGVKAAVGRSPHEDGRAIDLNVLVDGKRVSPYRNGEIIGTLMASEGFHSLGASDPVHYSLPRDAVDPALTKGPEISPMTMAQWRSLEDEALVDQPYDQPALVPAAGP